MQESGMFEVLDKNLSRSASDVLKELVLHQLIRPKSKLSFSRFRKNGLLYLLGGKREYKEDRVYMALDELADNMEKIKAGLRTHQGSNNEEILLYDLSNSYFTGRKAELGGRGKSKEKRDDRYIVTYGLVMNKDNMPLDIRIWKGGTADSSTVLETFSEWKQNYKADKAIWIADRSMSGEPTIEDITKLDLNYITGLPGQSQITVLMDRHERSPELFDTQDIASFKQDNKRFVLCRHHSKGFRKEIKAFERRRKVYNELVKIQSSPQNKNDKKLYHRAMRVIEKHKQTPFWNIEIKPIKSEEKHTRYRLKFSLDRETVKTYNKLGHFYVLQTDISEQKMDNPTIKNNYKDLIRVERSFRDIKSYIKIRPIRHHKERRIKAHIYLCYLSLWLSKYIENKWRQNTEVVPEISKRLYEWDTNLVICETVDDQGNMVDAKWNTGRNAKEVSNMIHELGEELAIKTHS